MRKPPQHPQESRSFFSHRLLSGSSEKSMASEMSSESLGQSVDFIKLQADISALKGALEAEMSGVRQVRQQLFSEFEKFLGGIAEFPTKVFQLKAKISPKRQDEFLMSLLSYDYAPPEEVLAPQRARLLTTTILTIDHEIFRGVHERIAQLQRFIQTLEADYQDLYNDVIEDLKWLERYYENYLVQFCAVTHANDTPVIGSHLLFGQVALESPDTILGEVNEQERLRREQLLETKGFVTGNAFQGARKIRMEDLRELLDLDGPGMSGNFIHAVHRFLDNYYKENAEQGPYLKPAVEYMIFVLCQLIGGHDKIYCAPTALLKFFGVPGDKNTILTQVGLGIPGWTGEAFSAFFVQHERYALACESLYNEWSAPDQMREILLQQCEASLIAKQAGEVVDDLTVAYAEMAMALQAMPVNPGSIVNRWQYAQDTFTKCMMALCENNRGPLADSWKMFRGDEVAQLAKISQLLAGDAKFGFTCMLYLSVSGPILSTVGLEDFKSYVAWFQDDSRQKADPAPWPDELSNMMRSVLTRWENQEYNAFIAKHPVLLGMSSNSVTPEIMAAAVRLIMRQAPDQLHTDWQCFTLNKQQIKQQVSQWFAESAEKSLTLLRYIQKAPKLLSHLDADQLFAVIDWHQANQSAVANEGHEPMVERGPWSESLNETISSYIEAWDKMEILDVIGDFPHLEKYFADIPENPLVKQQRWHHLLDQLGMIFVSLLPEEVPGTYGFFLDQTQLDHQRQFIQGLIEEDSLDKMVRLFSYLRQTPTLLSEFRLQDIYGVMDWHKRMSQLFPGAKYTVAYELANKLPDNYDKEAMVAFLFASCLSVPEDGKLANYQVCFIVDEATNFVVSWYFVAIDNDMNNSHEVALSKKQHNIQHRCTPMLHKKWMNEKIPLSLRERWGKFDANFWQLMQYVLISENEKGHQKCLDELSMTASDVSVNQYGEIIAKLDIPQVFHADIEKKKFFRFRQFVESVKRSNMTPQKFFNQELPVSAEFYQSFATDKLAELGMAESELFSSSNYTELVYMVKELREYLAALPDAVLVSAIFNDQLPLFAEHYIEQPAAQNSRLEFILKKLRPIQQRLFGQRSEPGEKFSLAKSTRRILSNFLEKNANKPANQVAVNLAPKLADFYMALIGGAMVDNKDPSVVFQHCSEVEGRMITYVSELWNYIDRGDNWTAFEDKRESSLSDIILQFIELCDFATRFKVTSYNKSKHYDTLVETITFVDIVGRYFPDISQLPNFNHEQLQLLLSFSVKLGLPDATRLLLTVCQHTDFTDEFGRHLLHQALLTASSQLAIEKQSEYWQPAISGVLQVIAALLEHNPKMALTYDAEGFAAMHYAAIHLTTDDFGLVLPIFKAHNVYLDHYVEFSLATLLKDQTPLPEYRQLTASQLIEMAYNVGVIQVGSKSLKDAELLATVRALIKKLKVPQQSALDVSELEPQHLAIDFLRYLRDRCQVTALDLVLSRQERQKAELLIAEGAGYHCQHEKLPEAILSSLTHVPQVALALGWRHITSLSPSDSGAQLLSCQNREGRYLTPLASRELKAVANYNPLEVSPYLESMGKHGVTAFVDNDQDQVRLLHAKFLKKDLHEAGQEYIVTALQKNAHPKHPNTVASEFCVYRREPLLGNKVIDESIQITNSISVKRDNLPAHIDQSEYGINLFELAQKITILSERYEQQPSESTRSALSELRSKITSLDHEAFTHCVITALLGRHGDRQPMNVILQGKLLIYIDNAHISRFHRTVVLGKYKDAIRDVTFSMPNMTRKLDRAARSYWLQLDVKHLMDHIKLDLAIRDLEHRQTQQGSELTLTTNDLVRYEQDLHDIQVFLETNPGATLFDLGKFVVGAAMTPYIEASDISEDFYARYAAATDDDFARKAMERHKASAVRTALFSKLQTRIQESKADKDTQDQLQEGDDCTKKVSLGRALAEAKAFRAGVNSVEAAISCIYDQSPSNLGRIATSEPSGIDDAGMRSSGSPRVSLDESVSSVARSQPISEDSHDQFDSSQADSFEELTDTESSASRHGSFKSRLRKPSFSPQKLFSPRSSVDSSDAESSPRSFRSRFRSPRTLLSPRTPGRLTQRLSRVSPARAIVVDQPLHVFGKLYARQQEQVLSRLVWDDDSQFPKENQRQFIDYLCQQDMALQTLKLSNCKVVSEKALFSLLSRLGRSLTKLYLNDCAGVGENLMAKLPDLCPNLLHLEVNGYDGSKASTLRWYFEQLKHFKMCRSTISGTLELCGPRLEQLYLSGTVFNHDKQSPDHYVPLSLATPKLKKLVLGHCKKLNSIDFTNSRVRQFSEGRGFRRSKVWLSIRPEEEVLSWVELIPHHLHTLDMTNVPLDAKTQELLFHFNSQLKVVHHIRPSEAEQLHDPVCDKFFEYKLYRARAPFTPAILQSLIEYKSPVTKPLFDQPPSRWNDKPLPEVRVLDLLSLPITARHIQQIIDITNDFIRIRSLLAPIFVAHEHGRLTVDELQRRLSEINVGTEQFPVVDSENINAIYQQLVALDQQCQALHFDEMVLPTHLYDGDQEAPTGWISRTDVARLLRHLPGVKFHWLPDWSVQDTHEIWQRKIFEGNCDEVEVLHTPNGLIFAQVVDQVKFIDYQTGEGVTANNLRHDGSITFEELELLRCSGKSLVTSTHDILVLGHRGKMVLIDPVSFQVKHILQLHKTDLSKLSAACSNHHKLVVASHTGCVNMWDLGGAQPICYFSYVSEHLTDTYKVQAVSPNDKYCAITWDNHIEVRCLTTGNIVCQVDSRCQLLRNMFWRDGLTIQFYADTFTMGKLDVLSGSVMMRKITRLDSRRHKMSISSSDTMFACSGSVGIFRDSENRVMRSFTSEGLNGSLCLSNVNELLYVSDRYNATLFKRNMPPLSLLNHKLPAELINGLLCLADGIDTLRLMAIDKSMSDLSIKTVYGQLSAFFEGSKTKVDYRVRDQSISVRFSRTQHFFALNLLLEGLVIRYKSPDLLVTTCANQSIEVRVNTVLGNEYKLKLVDKLWSDMSCFFDMHAFEKYDDKISVSGLSLLQARLFHLWCDNYHMPEVNIQNDSVTVNALINVRQNRPLFALPPTQAGQAVVPGDEGGVVTSIDVRSDFII